MEWASGKQKVSIILIVILFFLLILEGDKLFKAIAISSLCLFLWAAGWVPHWFTAVIFFTFCTVFDVAPVDVVFSGFSSSATWLIFSGFILGAAIQFTGLGDSLARLAAPAFSGSFNRAFIVSSIFGLFLAFFMPAALGRVLLIVPLLSAISERLGYGKNSSQREAVMLSGIMGTFFPTFAILPANVPNNVLMGAAESLLGVAPSYSEYFILHFPVIGGVKMILIIFVIKVMYPESLPTKKEQKLTSFSVSRSQLFLVLLLMLAVFLWITDRYHGIAPAWVGMLIAAICLAPGAGLMPDSPLKSISFEPLMYSAGIIGLGALAFYFDVGGLLIAKAGGGSFLVEASDFFIFFYLAGMAFLAGVFLTLPGVPAVMMPFVPELSILSGWSPESVYMTQVIGFSTVVLPYQSPALILGAVASGISLRKMAGLCLSICFLSFFVLWPMSFFWWGYLGWI